MPDFKNLGRDIANQARLVKKLATGDLQRIIGVEGKNHFEASWQKQGWEDQGIRKWDARKEPDQKYTKGGHGKRKRMLASYKKWRAKNAKRAILISHRTDTAGGHLKDSIAYRIAGSRIIFSTDKPYAQVHNEGGKAGRGAGFIMKQRQFMGRSAALDRKIKAKLDRELDKIFN